MCQFWLNSPLPALPLKLWGWNVKLFCFPDPDQWTMIPVLVKIYKLLINELSNQIENSLSTQAAHGDDDEDEVSIVMWLDALYCNENSTELWSKYIYYKKRQMFTTLIVPVVTLWIGKPLVLLLLLPLLNSISLLLNDLKTFYYIILHDESY